jgi:hypothetical protein
MAFDIYQFFVGRGNRQSRDYKLVTIPVAFSAAFAPNSASQSVRNITIVKSGQQLKIKLSNDEADFKKQ